MTHSMPACIKRPVLICVHLRSSAVEEAYPWFRALPSRWHSVDVPGSITTMKPGSSSLAKFIGCVLGIFAFWVAESASAAETTKPNVLFIAVDDLNHWVGHLGRNPQTKTPHIDRLARMGVTFTRAYCAAPICNPSRTALLSGRRPGATGVYDNNDPFRAAVTVEESLLMTFKKAGYTTL